VLVGPPGPGGRPPGGGGGPSSGDPPRRGGASPGVSPEGRRRRGPTPVTDRAKRRGCSMRRLIAASRSLALNGCSTKVISAIRRVHSRTFPCNTKFSRSRAMSAKARISASSTASTDAAINLPNNDCGHNRSRGRLALIRRVPQGGSLNEFRPRHRQHNLRHKRS
jgi:hypothetical protein